VPKGASEKRDVIRRNRRTTRDDQRNIARENASVNCARVSGDLTSSTRLSLQVSYPVGHPTSRVYRQGRSSAIVECRLWSRTIKLIRHGDLLRQLSETIRIYMLRPFKGRSRVVSTFMKFLAELRVPIDFYRIIDVPTSWSDLWPPVVTLWGDSRRVPIGKLGADAYTEDGSKNSRSCVRVEH